MSLPPVLFVTQGSGNSFKPMLVAWQLKRPCEVRFIDVLGGQTKRPEFLRINPRGAVPYMVLPDGRGLGESNALAWYLADGSSLMPSEAASRAQAIQWMIFEQTMLEPNISPARFFTAIAPALRSAHEHEFPGWLERGHKGLALLDAHLSNRAFVTDHGYSVADVAVYGYTHLAEEGGFDLQRYPAIQAWMRRVQATPRFVPVGELLNPATRALIAD
jgi:glutathione S-transferase